MPAPALWQVRASAKKKIVVAPKKKPKSAPNAKHANAPNAKQPKRASVKKLRVGSRKPKPSVAPKKRLHAVSRVKARRPLPRRLHVALLHRFLHPLLRHLRQAEKRVAF